MAARMFSVNRNLLNTELYRKIHSLWFAHQAPNAKVPSEESGKAWFFNPDRAAAKAFDQRCSDVCLPALESLGPSHVTLPTRSNFSAERNMSPKIAAPLLEVINSAHDESKSDVDAESKRALALVILLDQMPRNIFRANQGVIYTHYDRLAQALVRHIVSNEPRLDLAPWIKDSLVTRNFFYLALMHSEFIEDHDSLSKIISDMKLQFDGDEDGQKFVTGLLDFEDRHVKILRQFGRYPYRNAPMGRESTAAELDYEKNGGERFTA